MRKNGINEFWAQALCIDDNISCWEWQGNKFDNGYGRFNHNNKSVKSHRFSWEITYGPITPDKPFILHHCDNRTCIRPDHLWSGTHADNMQDMHRKNRNVGRAKLTPLQAIEIRALWSTGQWTQIALADSFNVSDSAIWFLVHNKTWTKVQSPA